MKTPVVCLVFVSILSTPGASLFAQPALAQVGEVREMRVLRGQPGPGHGPEAGKPTTYLGVAVSRSAELSAHLGLAPGMGLVVDALTPDSPAAAVLKPHDVLTRFDDQLLVNAEQLAVLVRARKEGEEVTLSYIRAGQPATAKVRLGTHTPPALMKPMGFHWEQALPAQPAMPGGRLEVRSLPGSLPRVEVDRTLTLAGGAADGGDGRVRVAQAPIARLMGLGDGNLVFSDDKGSLELKTVDGRRELTAKDPAGTVLFSGPITTEEERKALPEPVRARLQQLEGINTMRFRTEDHFTPGDVRVIMPGVHAQPIVLPFTPAEERARIVL